MTDIAQHPTKQNQRTEFSSVGGDANNLLVLKGNTPVTVYVRQATDFNAKKVAEFASPDPSGPYFSGGISWGANGENALFVTLSLAAPVSGIECDLPYSPPSGGSSSSQSLCILPAFEAKVTYQFFVTFDDGSPKHDPKIVVTPIESLTDNRRAGKVTITIKE